MRRAGWAEHERPGRRGRRLAPGSDLQRALDDVERLQMPAMEMQDGALAHADHGLEHAEALVAVLARSLDPCRMACERPALAGAEHDRLHR